MLKKAPRRLLLLAAIAALLLAVAPTAFAGKPAAKYAGTLTATPYVLHAGDTFTVSGCGYDPAMGNVIVGFVSGSWGSALDENGCFSIAGIPALSGDSLAAGTYEVSAYQFSGRRWTETGQTTVTVV